MESPLRDEIKNYSMYDHFFNWTMTYRMDSDIVRPYGWISDKTSPNMLYPPADIKWQKPRPLTAVQKHNHTHPKKKMIAWMVSNCETYSKREDYVRALNKIIPVDVFGACGDLECGKVEDHNTPECDRMLEEEYKFYISFENSLCSDYVTEKFYRTLSLDIVPIVMGGADYKKRAPPKSYIDVKDFESPEHLANFLLELDKDDEEYLSYFWWKVGRKYL